MPPTRRPENVPAADDLFATICDLCGWCRDDCQKLELSRSHQPAALCSHCREDLVRIFGAPIKPAAPTATKGTETT